MKGFVAVDGQIAPLEAASLPVTDRGFLLGDSVFEVMARVAGKTLDSAAHLARLRDSATKIELEIPWSDEEFFFEIEALAGLLGEPGKQLVRIVVTRGDGLGVAPLEQSTRPRRITMVQNAKLSPTSAQEGVKLKRKALGSTFRGPLGKASANYHRTTPALIQVYREGFDDLLWVNSEGEITESSSSNVFCISRQGDLVEIATPPESSGLLPGVTRRRVIELLTRAKIPVTERVIFSDELASFDEMFLTSSVRGLVPVKRVDQHQMPTTRPSAVFWHIRRLFDAWVAHETGQRIDWETGLPVGGR